jgi:hypothetical protein
MSMLRTSILGMVLLGACNGEDQPLSVEEVAAAIYPAFDKVAAAIIAAADALPNSHVEGLVVPCGENDAISFFGASFERRDPGWHFTGSLNFDAHCQATRNGVTSTLSNGSTLYLAVTIDRTADSDDVTFNGAVTFVARGVKYQSMLERLHRLTQGGRTCITGVTSGAEGELFILPEDCGF